MSHLLLKDDLLFTTITIAYQGAVLDIEHVLVDTGSATTILAVDIIAAVQIVPLPEDILHAIRGVGGMEVVFTRWVDYLQVGNRKVSNFEIEVGGMDYGFERNGILGLDFLTSTNVIINLQERKIIFPD